MLTVLRVDDIEIIKSFQDGNLGAFDEVVAEFRDTLVRHAIRRLHDVPTAEDAVQETFVRAYRSFDRLHEASRIGPWLHHILSNVCIDESNRRRREADKTERAGADPYARRYSPGVEQVLDLDVDTAPLADAIGTLPSSYQEALQQRFVDELSYEEMAAVAGTTEQNVRARVSRARSAMKMALRGVAIFPALMAGIMLRRGAKSSATLAERAIDRADTTQRLASTAESTVMVSKFAAQMAPAIEAVNTIAISAHSAAPSISKAAIGIGAIALAAVSANPERSTVIPPAPTPIVMQVEEPASAGVQIAMPAPVIPAADAAVDAAAETPLRLAAEAIGSSDSASQVMTPATEADQAPIRAAVEPTSPGSATGSDSPNSSGAPESDSLTAPDSPAVDAPLPVVLQGGSATAVTVVFAEIGLRTDFSGQMSLNVDGITTDTTFNGRWSIDTDTDRTGGHRLSGVVTMTIGGSAVEIRLAGHAQTNAEEGEPRTISGMFRTANGEAAGLVEAGTFTGSFGPGTLVLHLTS